MYISEERPGVITILFLFSDYIVPVMGVDNRDNLNYTLK